MEDAAPALPDGARAGERRRFGLSERQLALILLFAAPAFFASNMLVGRATHDVIPPVALAFWRWTTALLLLLPFTGGALLRHRRDIAREWRDLVVLGALGMGVCGAFVYIAADSTTATNIGLIYAASPILIVVLARFCYAETLSAVQGLGVGLSLLGVLAVICRGDPAALLALGFTVGDLWALAAMLAWAVYSVLLRYRPSRLPPMARFAAITGGGVLVLLPFMIAEALTAGLPALDGTTVTSVLTVAVLASFGAYQIYGLVQRVLGAGPTSLLMYLIPIYTGALAALILGERLEPYHLAGTALVLAGIFLATRRPRAS